MTTGEFFVQSASKDSKTHTVRKGQNRVSSILDFNTLINLYAHECGLSEVGGDFEGTLTTNFSADKIPHVRYFVIAILEVFVFA